ncbi:MAG: hypothetical protein HYX68_08620 [Planctomycetes bacterium]|nr:hypothetical protein [Planctomycetota bacterium]
MFRWLALVFGVFLCSVLGASVLRAVEFTIELKASAAKEGGGTATYPVIKEGAPRLVLVSSAKHPVKIQWTVRRTGKTTAKDVLVHFFAVRIDKPNQAQVPKLNKNVVAESAFTMDFKVEDKAEGELTFAAPRAGVYLLRLELKNSGGKGGAEPFAALDLSVR